MAWGERILASVFGLFGLLWIVQSLGLRYWSHFAPGSGFFPFWLGVVLVVLVAAFLVQSFRAEAAVVAPAPEMRPRIGKIATIIAGLVVCIGLLETLGFGVAVGAYLAFLIGVVERRSLVETLGTAIGATAVLLLIFKLWLKVPFPEGPWGF